MQKANILHLFLLCNNHSDKNVRDGVNNGAMEDLQTKTMVA